MTGREHHDAVHTIRTLLWKHGYRCLPVQNAILNDDKSGKAPIGKQWPVGARQNPPECLQWPPVAHALNTGILCDGLRVVDVDIDDPGMAGAVRVLALTMLGVTIIRIRSNSPRFLLVYRAAEGEPPKDFIKGASHSDVEPKVACKIEVLGKGQQFVAYGEHWSGTHLEWPDGGPVNRDLASCPAVTEEQVQRFLAAAALVIGAPIEVAAPKPKARARANGQDHAPLAGDTFFAKVNELALQRLDDWVQAMFPQAVYQAGTGAWRVASKDRGRPDLEEDISFHPAGIQDFGLEHGLSAIDVVIEHAGASDAINAAFWLCETLGVEPTTLGWKVKQTNGEHPPPESGGEDGPPPSSDEAEAAWRDTDPNHAPEGDPRPEPPPEPPDHQLPVIPWIDERLSDWADRNIPPQDWVMEGWIPRGQCTGLYGVAGILKTRLLIQLLLAKSKGLPFLGIPLEAGPVYGLFCEDTREEVVRRATRIAKVTWGFDSLADFPDFHFASLVGVIGKELVTFDNGAMVPTLALAHLDQKIVEIGAHLVTLDTLPHFYGGNEIVRREVTRFISQLEAIGIARECGLLFTAHPSQRGRQQGTLDSGSTGWEGGFRARITFHDPEEDANGEERDRRTPRIPSDRRILTLFKANYAAPGATIETVVKDGAFFITAVGPEAANRLPRSGPGRNDACDARFLELLAAVTADGSYVSESVNSGRYAPKVFARRPDGSDFSLPEYTRAMGRLFVAKRIRMGLHGWPASRANACIVDTEVEPKADDPEPVPENIPPETPAPPPPPLTKEKRDAAIAAYLKLDGGERALQRAAIAESLLGPKKLNVFDALVAEALKASPPHGQGGGRPGSGRTPKTDQDDSAGGKKIVTGDDKSNQQQSAPKTPKTRQKSARK